MASRLSKETDLNMSKGDCIVACSFYRLKKRGEIRENQLAVNDISPTCVDQPWKRLIVLNSPETQNVLGVAGSVAGQKESPQRPVKSGAGPAISSIDAARGGGSMVAGCSGASRGGER